MLDNYAEQFALKEILADVWMGTKNVCMRISSVTGLAIIYLPCVSTRRCTDVKMKFNTILEFIYICQVVIKKY